MRHYTAEVDFKATATPDEIMEEIEAFHGVYAFHEGRDEHGVTISFPADSAKQAIAIATAVTEKFGEVTGLKVLTSEEFDRQEGFAPIPDLVSVTQAAEMMGITRSAVIQRIETGSIYAVKVGNTWVIPSASLPTAN